MVSVAGYVPATLYKWVIFGLPGWITVSELPSPKFQIQRTTNPADVVEKLLKFTATPAQLLLPASKWAMGNGLTTTECEMELIHPEVSVMERETV